jgi:CheY-like chemotaxis protein
MPFMDGYEATQKIRQYLFIKGILQPIIIAVTGHTENEYIEKALDSGMNEVIFKPCMSEEIFQITDKIGFVKKTKDTMNILEGLIHPVDYD